MKAIILAAGKGTRLQPLTLEVPKAMVKVHGKTLLEHNMEKLLPYVNEFIIVVKYKKEKIINFFGDNYKGTPVRYHEQGEKTGTGGALIGLDIQGDCYVIASDAIYTQKDIDSIAKIEGYAVLTQEVENPEKYGIFKINGNNNVQEVVEKPQEFIGNLASLFYFKVNSKLIDFCNTLEVSPRGEYELTDALNDFIKTHSIKAIKIQDYFTDITSIEDLEKANTLIKPVLGTTQYLENIGEYEIHLGFPESELSEIVRYSQDETDTALQEGTGDKKRFSNIEKLSSWYRDEGRYPFSLLSKNGNIAGIWWGRPTKAPNITEILNHDIYNTLRDNINATHTSGVRIYPFARGERLGSPFLAACTRYYDSIFPNVHMCIDIDEANIPSQKAFGKIGFERVGYGKNINGSPETGKVRFVYLRISK